MQTLRQSKKGAMKKKVVFSILGSVKDFVGKRQNETRWSRWRPNVSLCYHQSFAIDELLLMHYASNQRLMTKIVNDIREISPQTQVNGSLISFEDPWDLEEVYTKLYDLCDDYTFDTDNNDYYFHITTGTHIAQIVIFLLTESRIFPGQLIQTSPAAGDNRAKGSYQIIDLNLSKFDQVADRFQQKQLQGEAFLKGGINTKNSRFNAMIEQIEQVAVHSKAPILLTGPTGAGKSQLASKIYLLKKSRRQVLGGFVAVNCATLRGDNAMSALFGHIKGAFTGAQNARKGFLRSAAGGVLFLDEIGELGLDEQAMLLHALESKTFFPVGSDKEVSADFQLIAGTNKDLKQAILNGNFREDLLARINLWTYQLPSLAERLEDIPANIEYELHQFSIRENQHIQFNKESLEHFLSFAQNREASWNGNFRDLNAAITRMATLSKGHRIGIEQVREEIERLKSDWAEPLTNHIVTQLLPEYFDEVSIAELDLFDQHQLNYVLNICHKSPSMAAAGRMLYQASRQLQTNRNDSQRLQKYLAKFGVNWSDIEENKK
jgi:transcriptional regulatory protein RtcR